MHRTAEKGFALILSLVLLLVMSLMGGSLIVIASGDHSNNNSSDQYQQTFYVAEAGLIEGEKWVANNYLGHWVPSSSTSMNAENVLPDDATEIEAENYETYKAAYSQYSLDGTSWVRHTYERGAASNGVTITTKTACMNSFKNISTTEDLKIAGKSHFDATHVKLPQNKSFYHMLIQPIVKKENFLESDDAYDWKSSDIDKLVLKEINYLKRYRYEFFVVNAGQATYRGTGSSIARDASGVDTQGIAYKVYACGIFHGKPSTEDETAGRGYAPNDIEIIIPLETLIVMPN